MMKFLCLIQKVRKIFERSGIFFYMQTFDMSLEHITCIIFVDFVIALRSVNQKVESFVLNTKIHIALHPFYAAIEFNTLLHLSG